MEKISEAKLKNLMKYEDLRRIKYSEVRNFILDYFKEKKDNYHHIYSAIDPRNEDKIIFCPERIKRYKSTKKIKKEEAKQQCEICEGKTTPIIWQEKLSENDVTFINENLYPAIISLNNEENEEVVLRSIYEQKYKISGLHFINWLSSIHTKDFHNMSVDDANVILKMIAEFEMYLLHSEDSNLPISQSIKDNKHYGYVSIIKNCGKYAGSTIEHPHIQIIHSNIIPRTIEQDTKFLILNKISFIEYIEKIKKDELKILEDEYIKAVIPYFMKRPYHIIIYPKDTVSANLHELTIEEIKSFATFLCKIIGGLKKIFENANIELSYNLLFHTGPVGTLYIELLPYLQTNGGYEQSGLYICDSTPEICKNQIIKEMK
ncbi:MAG TPA: hypothetical protein PLD27_01860 [bacterium]|nr:hypothetical protein [bacterium]HOL46711.1 hypothetical protein [bacterium]HPQ18399.1 hypothetical protein [bacterium]